MLHAREVEGAVLARTIAAFGILSGFQIADLGFALGFWFFLCLRLLVHMGICVDCCCFGCAWFTGVQSQIWREVTRKVLENR
jgi:hypothetical protein